MKNKIELYIKDLLLDEFANSQLGSKVMKAVELVQNVQTHIYELSEKKGQEGQLVLKIGSIITYCVIEKFLQGKNPNKLTKEDWKDIAIQVDEFVVFKDEQEYVTFVFSQYERYIRFSASQVSSYVSEDIVKDINRLADDLKIKMEELVSGEIKEVDYIESCLWISLEAMVKLLATVPMKYDKLAPEFAEFTQAYAIYAFEYARFKLYAREQEIVAEFLNKQAQMNEELQEKYNLFMEDLRYEANQFYTLIDKAFEGNFKDMFLSTIELSKAAGVDDSELLHDIDEIDDFFL